MKKYFKKIIYTPKTKEVKQAYEYWKEAVIKADLASLNKMYTENFSWTNEWGITNNKKENLRKIGSGNLQYLSWVNENITIKIDGDTAVLQTKEILRLLVYNQRVNATQTVTAVFINQNGKWLMAGGQETNDNISGNKRSSVV